MNRDPFHLPLEPVPLYHLHIALPPDPGGPDAACERIRRLIEKRYETFALERIESGYRGVPEQAVRVGLATGTPAGVVDFAHRLCNGLGLDAIGLTFGGHLLEITPEACRTTLSRQLGEVVAGRAPAASAPKPWQPEFP